MAADAPKKPCVCQVPCTEDLTDPDCPVCKAADAVPEDCAALTAALAVLREGNEWVCTTESELNTAMNNIQPDDTVILRLNMANANMSDIYTYTEVLLIVENNGSGIRIFDGNVGTCTIKSGNVKFNASVDSLTIEGGDVTLERNATVNDITMTGGAFFSRSGAQITGRFVYQGGTLVNGTVPLSGTGVFVNESGQNVTIQNPANPGEDVVISPGGEMDANGMVTDRTFTFSITPISGDGYEIVPLEGYSTSGIAAGGVCKFRIEIKEGYRAGAVAVKIGRVLLTPDSNDIYTITNIQEDIVLSVTGIKKLYSITVGVSGGGTAVASVQEATQGENVTLTATPDQNSVFAGWTIEEGAAPLADESAENTSFTMPAGNVTVKAKFDTVANNTITEGGLTVTASGGGRVEYTDGSGFILNGSGDYEISGEWKGRLNVSSSNKKAVITVPNGVTASVTLSNVTINVNGTDYACAFAVEAGGTANITLSGPNALTSGFWRAGLEVPENAKATIDGSGSLIANGDRGAGIGGDYGSDGGTITINGGTVEANGSSGAGIGGGNEGGDGGIITINGGTVEANGENGGAGIGGGGESDGGTITINGGTVTASSNVGAGIGGDGGTITINGGTVTASSSVGAGNVGGIGGDGAPGIFLGGNGGQFTVDGNAVVFATSNHAAHIGPGPGGSDGTKTLTEGVVFEGSDGTVYGSPELPGDLTIPDGSTLTVPSNTTVTNNGKITNEGRIENYGAVSGTGSLKNNGTVNDHSNGITVSVTGTGVNKPSEIIITFWKNGEKLTDRKAVSGDSITVQANVTQKNTRLLTAAPNEVIFKIGSTVLGTANVVNGTATLSLALTGDSWKPGSYTITAEYGGGAGLLPNDTGNAVLIVGAPSYTITASPATLDFGSKAVNYAAPDSQTVTITNTGNSPITGYTVTGSTNFDVTYASSAIPADGNATFTVQPQIGLAVNTYEETLTITTTESSTATVIVKFSVVDKTIPVTGVMLNKSTHSLYKNEIVILTATVQPDNATNKSVSWTSSNINVATVDASGKVTAHAVGTAAITATTNDGGKRAVCDITVKPDPPSGGSSSSGSGKSSYTNPDILYGTWVQADTGIWMFRQTGGSYVRNRWGKADGLWYYFDSDGKMLTGWQWLGNQWYYLHTEETAKAKAGVKEGAMASGWHFDPVYQRWFYLDEGGAMVAGWREIDGKWYYFNPVPDGQRGIMLTDAWIDGWYVDKDGIWDREAKKEK